MGNRAIHGHRATMCVAVIASLVMIPRQGICQNAQMFTPANLKWQSIPGYPPGYQRAMLEGHADKREPVTYRVRLPRGFRFEPHTHAWDEHVTVLRGTWYVGLGKHFDPAKMKSLTAGSFAIIPGGVAHYVMTREDGALVQVHGIGPVGLTMVNR